MFRMITKKSKCIDWGRLLANRVGGHVLSLFWQFKWRLKVRLVNLRENEYFLNLHIQPAAYLHVSIAISSMNKYIVVSLIHRLGSNCFLSNCYCFFSKCYFLKIRLRIRYVHTDAEKCLYIAVLSATNN